MTLPELLKHARKMQAMNQKQAAAWLRVSQGTISKYENGLLEPTLRDAFKITVIYKPSMSRIFGALMKTEK